MGGVCVCVHLLDRVAALACFKVALCSSLLFVKLLVSLVRRGEDRGKEGEDRGKESREGSGEKEKERKRRNKAERQVKRGGQ